MLGRGAELAELTSFLDAPGPGVMVVSGSRGVGKTALVARALEGRRAVHFQALPLGPGELVSDLEATVRAALGSLPGPSGPGPLPLPGPDARWEALLAGLVERTEGEEGLVFALDAADTFLRARRSWAPLLAEAVARARARGAGPRVILSGRGSPEEWAGGLTPDASLGLGGLPLREAGWGHGARSPEEAFFAWALLGDRPANLPPAVRDLRAADPEGWPPTGGGDARRDGPGEGDDAGPGSGSAAALEAVGRTVVRRVLSPGGDLFDAPMSLVEASFQRPRRYLALLRALSRGPLGWARVLDGAQGVETGGQLAPYLKKLEEEGLVGVERPLHASPGSRDRRYLLRDPFHAFWFGWVLPYRSLLASHGAESVWREWILPWVGGHLERCLARAARGWLAAHARELLPAGARSVGGLWGGEADFDAVAWLENGQVCYGLARWTPGVPDGESLVREMAARMKATRHGIGREARAPLYFLPDGEDEVLRRERARVPLTRVVTLADLMGPGRP